MHVDDVEYRIYRLFFGERPPSCHTRVWGCISGTLHSVSALSMVQASLAADLSEFLPGPEASLFTPDHCPISRLLLVSVRVGELFRQEKVL